MFSNFTFKIQCIDTVCLYKCIIKRILIFIVVTLFCYKRFKYLFRIFYLFQSRYTIDDTKQDFIKEAGKTKVQTLCSKLL